MYILAILLFSSLAFLNVFNKEIVDKYKVIFAFVCFIFLIFHDGLRWETGTDWLPYTQAYEDMANGIEYVNYTNQFESGYLMLFALSYFISDEYTVYLIIHAVIFYTLFFICIFKLSKYPFVSILVFYMVTLPYLGMNRQFIAMSIYAIGLIYLAKGQRYYYLLFIAIAFFFHHSVAIAATAVFFNKKIRNRYLLIVLGIALAISFSGIIKTLSTGLALVLNGSMEDKADAYTNMTNDLSIVSIIFSLIRKLLWISLLMIFDKKVDDKDDSYYTFFNMYFLGSIFYVLFNGTPLQIIVSRALIYFNIMEMFLIPYVLTIFKPNYGKLLIMFVLVAYCYINIKKGFDNFAIEGKFDLFEPYKGLFINTDYVRQTH